MKSAREMFSELEYSCKEDDDYIEYIQKIGDCTYEIAFDYDTEYIEFYSYRGNFEKKFDTSLSMEELQAINKQVEELGWDKE